MNRDFQVDVTFIYADTCMLFILYYYSLPWLLTLNDVSQSMENDPQVEKIFFLFLICHSNYKYISRMIQEQTDFSLVDKIESFEIDMAYCFSDNKIAHMDLYCIFLSMSISKEKSSI